RWHALAKMKFIQCAQAVAAHLLAADDPIDRNENVAAPVRAVRESGAGRQMPAADVDARMIGRDERQCDADVLALAEQVVLVEEAKRQTDEGRLRAERNVPLLPRQADAERLVALLFAARHINDVAHRGGVRT